MTLIPSGVLADLRTLNTATQTDVATVARTGAIVTVRVTDTEQREVVPHSSRLAPFRRFRLFFPLGIDAQSGDLVTVTGKGTYLIAQTNTPKTYSAGVTADAVLTNASVTFQRYESGTLVGQAVNVPAIVLPVDSQERLAPYNLKFAFEVAYSLASTLATTPPSVPVEGDRILWSGLRNRKGYSQLLQPAPFPVGTGVGAALFTDIS